MGEVRTDRSRGKRGVGAVLAGVGCLIAAFVATACLGAADLENPERFEALKEPPPPTNCDQELPAVASGCDYATPLRRFCAGSCHGSGALAGLNLTPDALLIARTLNVPALHGGIGCGSSGAQCLPGAPACESCATCPTNDFLLNKENFAESWIVRKMEAFLPDMATAPDIGCGLAMPPVQNSPTRGYTQAHKDCLLEFFAAIAATGRPCTIEPPDGGADAAAPDAG